MTTVNHHLILMAKPICHQSKIAICIHLILTDKKNVFKLCNNFETGLSGHHFLISTIMKSGYFKGPPKKKVIDHIKTLIRMSLMILWIWSFIALETIIPIVCLRKNSSVLNKQAPLETKLLRYNNNAFISKELKKSIMLQSKLKTTFNKNRSYENWCNYRCHCDLSVNLLRKTKRKLFRNRWKETIW